MLCCDQKGLQSISKCQNSSLIDTEKACKTNKIIHDLNTNLIEDTSSILFMKATKNLSMNSARVYYDNCFEVDDQRNDYEEKDFEGLSAQFFVNNKEEVKDKILFCGGFLMGSSFFTGLV